MSNVNQRLFMLEAQKCKKYTGKFLVQPRSFTKKKKIYLIFDYWVDFGKRRTKNISSCTVCSTILFQRHRNIY